LLVRGKYFLNYKNRFKIKLTNLTIKIGKVEDSNKSCENVMMVKGSMKKF